MSGWSIHYRSEQRHRTSVPHDGPRCPHCFDPLRSFVALDRHLKSCPVLDREEES